MGEATESITQGDMRKIFRFEFISEPGVDAGGVAREWFQLVSALLFNPDFALWSLLMNLMRSTKPGSFNLSRGLLGSQLKASALFKAMIIIFENLQSIQFQKLSLCSQKHIPASIE